MQAFQTVIKALAEIPAWVPVFLYPSVLIVFTALVLIFGGRRAYPHVAVSLGGGAFTLLACRGDLGAAFAFLGLYAALAAILKLFFLLPPMKPRKRQRLSKDERMYRKFHAAPAQRPNPAPPKVCKFEEEEPVASAEESGMQLKYADELLARLKKFQLSPSDRLEAEAMSRSLGAYRSRTLTEGEMSALNDLLASVLKMTAKYKL